MPRKRSRTKRLSLEKLEERSLLAGLGESVIVGFEVDPYAGPGPTPIAAPYLGLRQDTQHALSSMGAEVTRAWFDGRTREVRLLEGFDVATGLELLRTLPQVRYAILTSSVAPASVVPNDPLFVSQWPLQSSSEVDLNAPQAWDQTTGSAATLVAVADTGIDYTHPDLYLAIALNNAEIPASLSPQLVDTNGDNSIDFHDLNSLDAHGNVLFDSLGAKFNSTFVTDLNTNGYIDAGDLLTSQWQDGIDRDENGLVDDLTGWDHLDHDANPIDVWGHGTHVAGVIGARANNGVGIAGVNWNVRLIPERFIGSVGSVADMIDAIQHAVTQGASVINASWGTFVADLALKDAIQWAGENNVVFVAAAGNHSQNNDVSSSAYYPASFDLPNLISVAAVDSEGALSGFSNYGANTVSLGAPGSEVLSTWPNGSYLSHSGTSMATPHVSGVVSLLAGLYPDASAEWLADRVLTTVKPLTDLQAKTLTGGMVDAFVAVNTPNLAGPRVIAASPSGDVVTPTGRVTLTFDRPMQAETFSTSDIAIAGPAGPIAPIAVNRLTDLVFEVVFSPQTQLGIYSVTVGPEIEDQVGKLMDQDRDGNAGEPQHDAMGVVFKQVSPPQIWTIDDGDEGFASTGVWTRYTPDGYAADFLYTQAGSGSDVATWTFSDLTPGQYQIAVTWQPFANRVLDATYHVSDGGLELASVQIDQRQQPASFLEVGKRWQHLGSIINLTGDALLVSLDDLARPADGYLIADAVRLQRVGDLPAAAEIEVRDEEGAIVASETGNYDFGRLEFGSSATRTFTVRNAGLADLTLGAISAPAGFSLVSDFAATTLPTGEATSFSLQAKADSFGVFGGALSFTSNDADESPFSFNVSSFVAPVWIVDDGDQGFASSHGWSAYLGGGRGGDLRFKAAGDGDEVDSWSFAGLPAGRYRVSATWLEYSNRVGDARYTIYDDVSALGTITVDQRLAPSEFIDEGTAWHNLGGLVDVVGGVLRVELSDRAFIGEYMIADAVRIERIEDLQLPAGPEIQLFLGSSGLTDGVSAINFGRTNLDAELTRSFTIRNGGTTELLLGTIELPGGFSIAAGLGSTSLAPGETTSFEIRLDADSFGVFEGQVRVANNDSDEGSFDFTVQGSVSTFWTMDDGGPGFSATGGWTAFGGDGWDDDVLYRQVGEGMETASWTFDGLLPGRYRISATWLGYSNRAVDAEYQILDGTSAVGSVKVDQRTSPASFAVDGRWWQDLAGPYALVQGTLTVRLSDLAGPAGSYVIADAIRLERIGELSQDADPQVFVEGSSLKAGLDLVDFGNTESGTAVSKTFTVRNVGQSNFIIEQIVLPPGYSLITNPVATTLTTGQATTFVVQLDASSQGTFTGTMQIVPQGSGDSFDIGVTGMVATSVVSLVDNGDAAFSATSGWTPYVGGGTTGDCAYIQSGDGSEVATWTFAGIAPGSYRVSVTWLPFTNRAENAPFSVLDGSTLLITDAVDQRATPDDLFADGQWWHDLGGAAEVASGELVVKLANLAGPIGSYLIADAVRIERVGDLPG